MYSFLVLFNEAGVDLIRKVAKQWSDKENLVYAHSVHRIRSHICFTFMASNTTAIMMRRPLECYGEDRFLYIFPLTTEEEKRSLGDQGWLTKVVIKKIYIYML